MAVSSGSLLTILYVAMLASVLPFIFWNRVVRALGANIADPFIHVMPVFSTTLAVIFLGETLTATYLQAICLIFSGILMTTFRVRKVAEAEDERRRTTENNRGLSPIVALLLIFIIQFLDLPTCDITLFYNSSEYERYYP